MRVDSTWICVDCSLERGYVWPLAGHVHEKIGTCDFCGKRGVLFDKDDLVPGWQKDELEKNND
jgi:hypothetical protein